jgi:hypothetical protein
MAAVFTMKGIAAAQYLVTTISAPKPTELPQ